MDDHIDEIFEEYEREKAAQDRALQVYAYLDGSEYSYDDMEMYCISVLDSEFDQYPDGALEAQLRDVLYKLRNHHA